MLKHLQNIIRNFNIHKIKMLKEAHLKNNYLYPNLNKNINSKMIFHVQVLKISPITFSNMSSKIL